MDEPRHDLPAEIRAERGRRNLTQANAGAELLVSDQTFARWEHGEGLDRMNAHKLLALARWLHVPVGELVIWIATTAREQVLPADKRVT